MSSDGDGEVFDPARVGARTVARRVELRERRKEARAAVRRRPELDLLVPAGFADADSGRRALMPSPTLLLMGDYLRRSRGLAGMTQVELAHASGVSQPMISRIERARAPGTPLERVVALCQPLGRLFPFGVCPHDHHCPWQPYRPIEREIDQSGRFIERMLALSDEPSPPHGPSPALDFGGLAFTKRE